MCRSSGPGLENMQGPGVPVASHKTEGLSMVLAFLGIQIDLVQLSLSLAGDKLCALIHYWRNRQAATKWELQSLTGHFSHAAFIVLPGRTFLRRMTDAMSVAKQPHHYVWLNTDFLHWWATILPAWTGRSIQKHTEIYTDP